MTNIRQKHQLLASLELRLKSTTDKLGRPIDSGIWPTVLYLQALGITTSQSCEGHLDHGRPWPWVRIETTNEPEFRFEHELEIYHQICQEFRIPVKDLQRGQGSEDARQKLRQLLGHQSETSAFTAWAANNQHLKNKLADLLTRFYITHPIANEIMLEISKIGPASFELESAEPSRQAFYRDKLDQNSLKKIKMLLPARQAEMRRFGEFLESQFWLDETVTSTMSD